MCYHGIMFTYTKWIAWANNGLPEVNDYYSVDNSYVAIQVLNL